MQERQGEGVAGVLKRDSTRPPPCAAESTGEAYPGVLARLLYGVVLLLMLKTVSVVAASLAMDFGWLPRQSISRHLFHPLAYLLIIAGGYAVAPRLWACLPLWGLKVARPAEWRQLRRYLRRLALLLVAGVLLLCLIWRGLRALTLV